MDHDQVRKLAGSCLSLSLFSRREELRGGYGLVGEELLVYVEDGKCLSNC